MITIDIDFLRVPTMQATSGHEEQSVETSQTLSPWSYIPDISKSQKKQGSKSSNKNYFKHNSQMSQFRLCIITQ